MKIIFSKIQGPGFKVLNRGPKEPVYKYIGNDKNYRTTICSPAS